MSIFSAEEAVFTRFSLESSHDFAAVHPSRLQRCINNGGQRGVCRLQPLNHQRVNLKAVSRCGRGLPLQGAQSSAVNHAGQKLLDAFSAFYAVGTWDYAACAPQNLSVSTRNCHTLSQVLWGGEHKSGFTHARTHIHGGANGSSFMPDIQSSQRSGLRTRYLRWNTRCHTGNDETLRPRLLSLLPSLHFIIFFHPAVSLTSSAYAVISANPQQGKKRKLSPASFLFPPSTTHSSTRVLALHQLPLQHKIPAH